MQNFIFPRHMALQEGRDSQKIQITYPSATQFQISSTSSVTSGSLHALSSQPQQELRIYTIEYIKIFK